ncbi:MAG TPA: Rieske 2Fe-2S domain-containing protein [Trueperaceae bacterium]
MKRPGGLPDQGRRRLNGWFWRLPVVAALAALGVGGYEAYRVHFAKIAPDPTPEFAPKEPEVAASLSALADVWAAQAFTFGGTPAVVLHLPAPIPGGLSAAGQHYAAFSRICTHRGCIVAYNTDADAIDLAFNYRPPSPALVCHCHLSVFLPAEAGEVVSGPARMPLPRIALDLHGDTLYAVGIEVENG